MSTADQPEVFKTALIDKVFFLRWEQPPSSEAIQQVASNFQRAFEHLREPMCAVVTSAPKARLPNGDERRNLNKLLEDNRQFLSQLHLVIEGNELQHNLQRVIVSGMLILTRTYDDQFARVHRCADTAAPYLSSRLGVDGSRIISEARTQGLVL
jgi:hypothetical protein